MTLPSGTVTFLFTDIEGSTKLAQGHPDKWESLQQRHHAILQSVIEAHNGHVFQIIGDAFCAAFHTAIDGLRTAIHAQRKLQTENWDGTSVKVRMGIHTGSAELRGNDYHGYLSLVLVQRVMSVAYGEQILLSNASAELLHNELPEGITLRDMKEHRLKGLLNPERLWQIVTPDLQRDFPPLRSLNETPNNLPIQLTTFIGREKEVEQIKKRLEKNRLVTLTGSGGIGKTRLSIQVASELLTEYPNGVWLVELAPLTDPMLVSQSVCTILGVTLEGNASALDTLTEYLKSKKILLVVDNCEHLIDACAQLCEALLHACPNLQVIASSREALGIDGENAYRVPSLSLPDSISGLQTIEKSEAVKLFMERANALLPDFELTEANVSSVVQICQRLDGIALAIELAASRVKMLKVEQIAARLDDAFRLLTGGSRTALPRQQTLHALIDWSYNLLSEEEQILLRQLSVFTGGWNLESAETVCNNPDMLELLTRLVDKSLVVVDYEHGDEVRYYLLETIRQYARAKFFETDEVQTIRNLHLLWVLDWAEKIGPDLSNYNTAIRVKQAMLELDNIRSAIEWGLGTGQVENSMKVVIALELYWYGSHPYQESRRWLKQGLALRESLNKHTLAKILFIAAWLAYRQSDQKELMLYSQESLSLARELNNKSLIADAICIYSEVYYDNGQFKEWEQYREEARSIYHELGDKEKLFWYDSDNIVYLMHQGEYYRADKILEDHINQLNEADDIFKHAWLQSNLGFSKILQGEFEQAIPLLKNSLPLFYKSGDILFIGTCLKLFSGAANGFNNPIRAAKLFGASEKVHETIGVSLDPGVQRIYDSFLAQTKSMLDEAIFKSAWAQGKAMTIEQAIEYALEDE